LSGTGVADYCDILLKPCNRNAYFNNGYQTSVDSGYCSLFSKNSEIAEAGFYSVELDEGITVELTATERAGFHRYVFEDATNAHVMLDLSHRDKPLDIKFDPIDEFTVQGMRRSQSWAEDQVVFYFIQFSKPIAEIETKLDVFDFQEGNQTFPAKNLLSFDLENGDTLLVKVGISAVDIAGAKTNLLTEIPAWDFDAVREESKEIWNQELSKIEVEGSDENKTIFYSALYHTMIAPNLFSDVDGRYRKMVRKDSLKRASEIGQLNESEKQYTIFSLWDTYRATHPLYTIIDQKRTNHFVQTFLRQYKDGGQLPVWELAGNYTGCMIGYHSVPVIVDAYVKGINNWDTDLALEAMQHSATLPHLGLPSYMQKGFIPTGDEPESVSKTLEYAYDDWCIATMADKLGKAEVAVQYYQRSQSYKNLFNQNNGFLQGRTNGGWYGPFIPEEVNFNYTEANGWQYSLAVPHDVSGLMDLMGGKDSLVNHLDRMFEAKSQTEGRHQVDITGLIGQYAHGNEPSHHMAYLYNYANQPWKTQQRVSEILETMYQNAADGLSGNEDCGQMSAWYVLSSMGFYPVCPGSDQYVIGTPLFDSSTINLEGGNKFQITRSGEGIYIQSTTLNGEPMKRSFITHSDIMNGGKLHFEMGTEPNRPWGVGEGIIPVTSVPDHQITIVPTISASSRTFSDSLVVEISSPQEKAAILYRLITDSKVDTGLYYNPITIHESTLIEALAVTRDEVFSKRVKAEFNKIDGSRTIKLNSQYANQYSAGGDGALIDQIKGGKEFRTGDWQGYREDLEAVVDLGSAQHVSEVSLGCLQDIKSWIWFPKVVKFYCSEDGETWTEIEAISQPTPTDTEYGAFMHRYASKLDRNNVKYIKVFAKNYGQCPDWHLGSGGKTWLFVDEISIK
jgi:predicted alpha-1,2-mannosidase